MTVTVPFDQRAERQLVAQLLIDPVTTLDKVPDTFRAEDFYQLDCRAIWRTARELAIDGIKPDAFLIADALRHTDDLDAAGGVPNIIGIQEGWAMTRNADEYARIVTEYALLRQLQVVGSEIMQIPVDVRDPVKAANEALVKLQRIVEATNRDAGIRTLEELMPEWLDLVERRSTGEAPAFNTGLIELDLITKGIHNGEFVVIGGRPGMGKSTLGANLAIEAAEQGLNVLVISLEMSRSDLIDRLVASKGRIEMTRLRAGDLTPQVSQKMASAVGNLIGKGTIWIVDSPSTTIQTVADAARRLNPHVIIIDYVQLMPDVERGSGGNREQVVAEIANTSKIIARDNRIVFGLAQVNRNVESRADRRPTMADLRESGAIEANADQVWFVYRDEEYDEHSADRGIVEVIVAKNRQGDKGTARLAYLAHYQKIANMARATPPPDRRADGGEDR